MDNFLKAAISYHGFADRDVRKVEVFTDAGEVLLAIELKLGSADLAGIAKRMDTLAAEAPPQTSPPDWFGPALSDARMRDEYNGMDKATKSRFGSFSRYKAYRLQQEDGASEQSAIPEHVYLWHHQISAQQRAMAVGMDVQGRYAIALDDLDEAQRAAHEAAQGPAEALRDDYVQRTVAAHARLNGTDGMPTSNADDFGGLPG